MTKRLYIETVGCQMNVLDSEMVVANLRQHGYELVQASQDADVMLYNSCSVRQMAEEKIYSAVGEAKRIKEEHPDRVIGIMGCMAQKDQAKIFERAPHVDLVIGPGQLHQIPELIEGARGGERQQVCVSLGRKDGSQEAIRRSHETFDPLRDPSMRPTPFQAYLRIQIGCDKFCTYCVVPMTRGPEQGRRPQDILLEARTLADQGCKEITLLGQTVNSYKYTDEGGTTQLSDLLRSLHEVDGIERLKFVTNYPKDMTAELLRTVNELPKCSPYLHVPAQSGSDEILKRMRRGYTIADYLAMMDRIRKYLPGAAISSDFIVGFCGETEEQFQMTMDLVRECRFKNSFIFQYSVREGTKANERLEDDIPLDVKKRRNNELLELQNQISLEDNEKLVGETVQVLVEGPSKKAIKNGDEGPLLQMTGRTHCDRIVVFDGNRRQEGQLLDIVIREALCHTLIGTVHTKHHGPELFALAGPATT